jgi:hypothetical protein
MADPAAAVVKESVKETSRRLLELHQQLTGEAATVLGPEVEKALSSLHDDEFERLPRPERRRFWNEILKRELKKAGISAGVLATSGLTAEDAPTQAALAAIAKQAAGPVKTALDRLRMVAIDCVSCESLVLPRFKAEDDRCRSCGALLPVAEAFGHVEDAAAVAAQLEQELAESALAADVLVPEPPAPPTWEVVALKPDLKRLLVLSPENLDWDELKKREDEARLAAKKAADEAARKVAEEKRRVEEEKKKKELEAAEAKRKFEEEKRKREQEAAAAAARVVEEKRKAEEAVVVAKKKAEEAAAAEKRRVVEEAAAAKKKIEAETAARAQAEKEILAKYEADAAKAKADEEEAERRRRAEDARLAIGCLTGPNADKIIRIDDLDPKLKPSGKRPLIVMTGGKAKILVPSGTKCLVNDKAVAGICELTGGDIVTGLYADDDLAVIEENGELRGVNADPVHLKRADEEGGGPWNYWNEPVRIGAGSGCEVFIHDHGVDEVHATVTTRFGRVVVEDACTEEDGLYIDNERKTCFLGAPGTTFRLGTKGPSLTIVEGSAEMKESAVAAKAGPMKPARYVRTILHVQTAKGEQEKIFLFARREVRFGRLFSRGDKVENDLVIAPADALQSVGDKQGTFALSRDGVTVQRNDKKVDLSVNDEELAPGQTVTLKRRFTIEIGTGIVFQGEAYRAPIKTQRTAGPAQLGVEGGHPYECVRMSRDDSSHHTYVYLVRQIRLGSGATDSIKLPGHNVGPGHATIMLARGVLQIVAPRDKHKVKLDGQTLETGVATPLKLGSKILLGDCLIRFEVAAESDFQIEPEEANAL